MERAIVVRGKLADSQHIELDEPVTEIAGEVEVVLRSAKGKLTEPDESIFDRIARLPGGNRSKEDLDGQVREERESWGGR